MSLLNQMHSIKQKVELLLTKHPHLRDDDFKLVATFHYNEIGAENIKKLSAMDLLQLYADGKLTSGKSITRVRATIQKDNAPLRGNKYNDRQNDGEDFKNNIGDL